MSCANSIACLSGMKLKKFVLFHLRPVWTRNARKSIKGLKDADSSLISNENFSLTVWPRGWALGQVT